MTITMPKEAAKIIQILNKAGHEAYIVGGCVRDCLLGKEPKDWDITTSALPEEVKSLFHRTIDTGIQHGTVTVMMNHIGYEVTTYRIDGEYEDGRHPKEVTFTRSLGEDLRRRDFTINAMAYNETDGLVDLFDGQRDLKDGIIRCVGDPVERFTEDALRMLRAVRFSAALGFEIEENTAKAAKQMAQNLSKVSAERIQTELIKTVISPNPIKLRAAYEFGLTKVFLPEFDTCMECVQNNPNHLYTVGEHCLRSMELIEADKVLRLTMLLHDVGKPVCKETDAEGIDHFHGHNEKSYEIAKEVLKRLKFDNATIDKVSRYCRYHDVRIEPDKKSMRRTINRLGEDLFPGFFKVQRADVLAQSNLNREGKLSWIARNEEDYASVIEEGECVSLKDLAVTGKDLIEAGIRPGKEIGEILNSMLNCVLEDPKNNEKSRLFELCLPKMAENREK
ncbi:MAG: CCA tRNA nucleotidyltransferase [Lachnospiraceae bacterium]|nr:CCA tRNA nucleotidyltransferase [Lachnospiraceae bacterium]